MEYPTLSVKDLSIFDQLFFNFKYSWMTENLSTTLIGFFSLFVIIVFVLGLVLALTIFMQIGTGGLTFKDGMLRIAGVVIFPLVAYVLTIAHVPSTLEYNLKNNTEDLMDIAKFNDWYISEVLPIEDRVSPDEVLSNVNIVGMERRSISMQGSNRFKALMEQYGFDEYYIVEYLKSDGDKYITLKEENVLLFVGESETTLSTYRKYDDGTLLSLPTFSKLSIPSEELSKYTEVSSKQN